MPNRFYAFLPRPPLSVRLWHFWTKRNIPLAIFVNLRGDGYGKIHEWRMAIGSVFLLHIVLPFKAGLSISGWDCLVT